jgi:hypothetical protein
MTDIRVSHLVKQYEEKTAVNDINFTVGEHEFLVLVALQAVARRPPYACWRALRRLLAAMSTLANGA